MLRRIALGLLACGALPASIRAAAYAESSQGDLSDDRLAPTPIALGLAGNPISGTVTRGDLDYFTVNVPAGGALSAVTLDAYRSSNARAFIGLQAGTTFTLDPADPDPALLLGYAHYGFDTPVGQDLLDDIARTPGTIGFAAPLPPGDYVLWLNQTEPAPTAYGFNFVVVPEPTAPAALAATGLLARRRPRRPTDRLR